MDTQARDHLETWLNYSTELLQASLARESYEEVVNAVDHAAGRTFLKIMLAIFVIDVYIVIHKFYKLNNEYTNFSQIV